MKKLLLLIFGIAVFLFPTSGAYALQCGEDLPDDAPEGVVRDYVASCQSKIASSKGEQATLASAIGYLNTQISLARAEIIKTQQDLDRINLEISDLSGKIENIDYSLDDLTELFVSRVKSSYKESKSTNIALSLFNTSGFFDFFRHFQYVQKIRDHDQEVLISLESARLDLDQQKSLKELKQAEVQSLKIELSSQQAVLNGQVATKNKLLADTKNDEKKYASLLSSAQSQLAAFQRFVAGQGGAGLLGSQTQCNDWGCYYNQRDQDWGNQSIGLSSSSMREYGCLVTSMAMVASHYGKSVRPGDIAASSDPFWGTSAYMLQGSWSAAGVTMSRTRLGSLTSHIDSELAEGRPVIVGIYGGPDHFLVVKEKVGDDYRIHDPFPESGSDVMFSDRYPLSAISAVDRVTVN
jgi:peptidoglycan hydrolase CwlO-like protein